MGLTALFWVVTPCDILGAVALSSACSLFVGAGIGLTSHSYGDGSHVGLGLLAGFGGLFAGGASAVAWLVACGGPAA